MSSFSDQEPSLPLNDESVLPGFVNRRRMNNSDGGGGGGGSENSGETSEVALNVSLSSEAHRNNDGYSNNVNVIGVGCTMREYEEQLNTLRKENLNLKLRIYMMEKSLGTFGSHEEKENVYKINVDLRVETEELKKELDEKKELLGQAYNALSSMEQKLLEAESNKTTTKEKDNEKKEVVRKQNESSEIMENLLHDAFGSINLGRNKSETEMEEELKKKSVELDRMYEIMKQVYRDVIEEVEEEDGEADFEKMSIVIRNRINLGSSMTDKFRDEVQRLTGELEQRNSEISRVLTMMAKMKEDFLASADTKEEAMTQLVQENNEKAQELEAMEKELAQEKESNDDLQKYVNNKLKEIADLHKELRQSHEFVQGLTKALAEQKALVETLKAECGTKDKVIEKLTNEYNSLKAKIRGKRNNEDFAMNLVSELDEFKSREALLQAEAEHLRDQISILENNEGSKAGGGGAAYYWRQGCEVGIQKAHEVYASEMKLVQKDVLQAVAMMRKRLQELVEFLTQLLSSNPDLSSVSMESLQVSLNESRRLSMMSTSMSFNESDVSGFIDDDILLAMMNRKTPEIKVSFEDEADPKIVAEYNSIIDELRQLQEDKHKLENELSQLKNELANRRAVVETDNENKRKTESESQKSEGLEETRRPKSSKIPMKASKVVEEEEKVLKEKLKEGKAMIESLKRSRDSYEAQLRTVEAEMEKIKSENQEKISELENRVCGLNEAEAEYERKLRELSEENSELQTKIEKCNRKLSSVCAAKSSLEADLAKLKSSCCEDEEHRNKLMKDLQEIRAELEAAREKMAKEKMRREGMDRELARQLTKTKTVLKKTQKFSTLVDKENKEKN